MNQGGTVRWFLPALVFLALFLLWPLAAIAWRALTPEGAPSAEALRIVVEDPYYRERLTYTTAQAFASTALALLVGVPAAYVFSQLRFPLRALLRALITVPFVLPTLVVALAFEQLLGPAGWPNRALAAAGLSPVNPLGTLWAILAAHVFYNVSVVVRLVGGVWANLDPCTEEAATMLGAGRVQRFRAVTLPALAPALLSAAALVFTFTFTSFGVVIILGGGNPALDTLEVVIYRSATRLVDLPVAAAVSAVQIVTTVTMLVAYALLQRQIARPLTQRTARPARLRDAPWSQRLLALVVVLVLTALIVAPMAALVLGALTAGNEGHITYANFTRLFEDTGRTSFIPPLRAVHWSLLFAAGSSVIAVAVGLPTAVAIARVRGPLGALADGLLMLPLAVPAVTLGFGYLVTFNRAPFDLRGSPWLVLAVHALIGYPFVVRAVLASLRSLDPRLPEAAIVLGASPRQAWLRVQLPLVARALLTGAVFAFAISLGEFGATLLLQRNEFATIPIAIYEALGRPGDANFGRALAMATILMGITTVAFLVIERIRYREVGEF